MNAHRRPVLVTPSVLTLAGAWLLLTGPVSGEGHGSQSALLTVSWGLILVQAWRGRPGAVRTASFLGLLFGSAGVAATALFAAAAVGGNTPQHPGRAAVGLAGLLAAFTAGLALRHRTIRTWSLARFPSPSTDQPTTPPSPTRPAQLPAPSTDQPTTPPSPTNPAQLPAPSADQPTTPGALTGGGEPARESNARRNEHTGWDGSNEPNGHRKPNEPNKANELTNANAREEPNGPKEHLAQDGREPGQAGSDPGRSVAGPPVIVAIGADLYREAAVRIVMWWLIIGLILTGVALVVVFGEGEPGAFAVFAGGSAGLGLTLWVSHRRFRTRVDPSETLTLDRRGLRWDSRGLGAELRWEELAGLAFSSRTAAAYIRPTVHRPQLDVFLRGTSVPTSLTGHVREEDPPRPDLPSIRIRLLLPKDRAVYRRISHAVLTHRPDLWLGSISRQKSDDIFFMR